MGVTIAVTRSALNTSTGTQDFTSADCGGLTPKAAMFFLTKGITDGVVASNNAICIGATDGTRQWSMGTQAEDAQTTTDTDRFSESDHCVAIQDVAGAIEGSAVFSAWITNGITINIDDAFPAGYLLTVVFYCGTDLTAYAGSADLGNTVDLETNITAPGFQPDLVFSACVAFTTMDSVAVTSILNAGVAHEAGGTVTQRCLGFRNTTNQPSVTMVEHLSTLYGTMNVSISGAIAWGGEFANFDSSGFSIFTRIAGSGNQDIGYLALKFGGAASAWVGTVASPTSTGNASITAPGFKPQFVMQGLSMTPAVNTAYADDNANSFGVGVMTANAQFSNAIWDDDGAADSNSECISDDTPINIQNGVDGTGLAASFVSFDTTGWTVNYSDVEAAAKQSWAVAIQEVSGVTPVSASDIVSLSISESASVVISNAVSTSDTASINLTETSTVQVSVNPNDSVSLSITESASSEGNANPSDPQNIGLSETASLLVTVSVSDIASLSLTESASVTISVVASVSDTFSISITESSSLVITIPAVYVVSPADIVVQDVQLFTVSLDGDVVYNISVGDT